VHPPIQNAPCWCPFKGRMPCSDNEHFEALTAAVFSARFNVDIVRDRWPAIRQAFAGFDLDRVASWPDGESERLLAYPGMIRNRKKIMATLRNARVLLDKVRLHGSVHAYLLSHGSSTQAVIDDLDSWAHYIGAPSLRCYLDCIGFLATDSERPALKKP
jgi:3-methyladenine DNA glycosylase Tag